MIKDNHIETFKKFHKNIINNMQKSMKQLPKKFTNKKDNIFVNDLIDKFNYLNCDGKYIRASLIALGYLNNHNDKKWIPLAESYETFQTAILVHDDIIDNAKLRRGKDCIPYQIQKEYKKDDMIVENSNSLALCMGDLGFYFANKIIIDNYYKEKNFKELLTLYNDIVINTIKGEILDVKLPYLSKYQKYDTKEEEIMDIYRLKTSWYTITGPFLLGTTLGGTKVNKSLIKALENIGISFQIKDDILGVFQSVDVLGKPNFSDIEEFKQTILYSYTINTKYKNDLLSIYGKNNLTVNDLEKVRNIFIESKALDYADKMMEKLLTEAQNLIEKAKELSNETKEILYGLIIYMKERKK